MFNGGLVHWIDGLPYVHAGGENTAAFKYWSNGLPIAGQDNVTWAYLRPSATDTAGAWVNELGGSTLSGSLDETTRNDADYIRVTEPASEVCRVELAGAASIDSDYDVYVKYAMGCNVAGLADVTVRLIQDVTTIATWIDTGIDDETIVYAQTLTSAQMAAVDWNDQTNLKLEFEASV